MTKVGEEPSKEDKYRINLLERIISRSPQENNELQELYLHRWLWDKIRSKLKKIIKE